GAKAPAVSRSRGAVSSRIDHDSRRRPFAAQFSEPGRAAMSVAGKISGLLDKVMRRENLTMDESADAMAVIMSGDATPAQISGLLVGLTMKGERPSEIEIGRASCRER